MTVNENKTEINSCIKFPETQVNYFHDFHKEWRKLIKNASILPSKKCFTPLYMYLHHCGSPTARVSILYRNTEYILCCISILKIWTELPATHILGRQEEGDQTTTGH